MNYQKEPIAVIGATGHTGRFVLDELERRGRRSILVARDAWKLAAAASLYRGSMARVARVDDPASLDEALRDAAAVINCAGPFLDTALPVVDAALRAKVPYLDVTAEQAVVRSLYARDADARCAGVAVLPAAAFFGGLGDLLATSAIDDATTEIDEIAVAVALDGWHPTTGTRLTGARNTARRLIVRGGTLQPLAGPQVNGTWAFPAPFGNQEVAPLPLSETITIARHLKAATIESWINLAPLRDVADPTTPPPEPVDELRRSAQKFVMDVRVRTADRRRRATAFGRDIYAVSATVIVEALERVLSRADVAGVRSLGEVFDARAFLETLGRRADVRVRYDTACESL